MNTRGQDVVTAACLHVDKSFSHACGQFLRRDTVDSVFSASELDEIFAKLQELISVDEKQVIGVEARFFMPSEASDVASCHSLDSKATKLLLQRAAGPANSGTLIRSCSETQSDYVLDAGISIRSQIDKTNIMFVRTCTPKESFEEENKVSSSSDQEDVSLNSIMTDAKGPCVMEEVFELHVDE